MKQDAGKLLPGTVVKNSIGEMGTLITLGYDFNGKPYWMIDWGMPRGLSKEYVSQVQFYELV